MAKCSYCKKSIGVLSGTQPRTCKNSACQKISCDKCAKTVLGFSAGKCPHCGHDCRWLGRKPKAEQASSGKGESAGGSTANSGPSASAAFGAAVGAKMGEALVDGMSGMLSETAAKNEARKAAEKAALQEQVELENKLIAENPEQGMALRAQREQQENRKKLMLYGGGGLAFLILIIVAGLMAVLQAPDELPAGFAGSYINTDRPGEKLLLTSGGLSLGDKEVLTFTTNMQGGFQKKSETGGSFRASTADNESCKGGLELAGNQLIVTISGDGGCEAFNGAWKRE